MNLSQNHIPPSYGAPQLKSILLPMIVYFQTPKTSTVFFFEIE